MEETVRTAYLDYGGWIRRHFPFRVQKIAVDAGFSCPNRDGRVGTGGCTFCDNRTFNPAYCNPARTITQQLEDGKAFFARKYPDMRYLAYFQAYSGTYAPVDVLRRRYEEALAVPGVVGLVVGTRPDCVDDARLDLLAQLARHTFVMVEYGIESANDDTLRRIHRGHDFACSRRAVEATHARGLFTGGHVILGLPGEDARESLRQAPLISALPLDVLKLHQLQIIRGTRMAADYGRHPFHLYSVEEYLDLVVRYIALLRPTLALERFVSQSPPEMLIAPRWGLKNYQFVQLLQKRLAREAGR